MIRLVHQHSAFYTLDHAKEKRQSNDPKILTEMFPTSYRATCFALVYSSGKWLHCGPEHTYRTLLRQRASSYRLPICDGYLAHRNLTFCNQLAAGLMIRNDIDIGGTGRKGLGMNRV
jgi:hypothetical protein